MNKYKLRLRICDLWLLKRLGQIGTNVRQELRKPSIEFSAYSYENAILIASSLVDDMNSNGYLVRCATLFAVKDVPWNPDGKWNKVWSHSEVDPSKYLSDTTAEQWGDSLTAIKFETINDQEPVSYI